MKKQGKKTAYPTKTTLNLLIREKKGMPLRTLIPVLVVLVAGVALLCKYGVVERLSAASSAERAAAEAEQALAAAQEELLDYDEVEAEYARYFSDALRSDDMPQECADVLDMIEEKLMPRGAVASLSFSQDTLILQLNVSRLGDVADIIQELYAVPMVEQVTITTASDAAGTVSLPAEEDTEASDTEEETGDTEDGEAEADASTGVSTIIMTITLQEVEE